MAPRQRAQARGAGAGDRLGAIEFVDRFVLAEVGAVVQLLQKDQARTGGSGLGHAGFDQGEVGVGLALVALLHQGHAQRAGIRHRTRLLAGSAW